MLPIAAVLLAAGAVFAGVRLVAAARYRRRRGRWGLLQDRFGMITAPDAGAGVTTVATNARRAAAIDDAEQAAAARVVADELNRAAFDPTWVDDDERYERTRSALAVLERSSD